MCCDGVCDESEMMRQSVLSSRLADDKPSSAPAALRFFMRDFHPCRRALCPAKEAHPLFSHFRSP